MKITEKTWVEYVTRLARLNERAGTEMAAYIARNGTADTQALTEYAYALVQKYGEGSAELACRMYDEVAEASGAGVPPAEPAEPAGYGEVARMVEAARHSPPLLRGGVSRLVKRAGADTTLKNAQRDGAEFAWVPHGDTCPFCLMLASRGWRRAGKKTLQGGHARHIHANCDCEYAVRFDSNTNVAGYDPEKYLAQYNAANGDINAMRRAQYAQNKDKINAQKRAAYAERLRDGSDDDIIETEKTVIQMRKLTDFLLKPGAKHSQEFFDVGYTEKDTAQLAADIAAQYNEDKRVDFKIADNGTEKFSVFMELGKKERKLFQTVWQIDLGSKKPRLITSHRVSRKKGGEGK